MKKLVAFALAGVLAVGTLAGCGAKENEKKDDKVVKVAASATPHAEILEEAAPLLKEKGFELEVKVFDDYVQPNEVVESGDFDANYFQHVQYMEGFNKDKGTHLVIAGKIHYEPFGLYPGAKSDLEELAEGDKIAVPNDGTNEARALLLLQENGIIKLKKDVDLMKATVTDIAENPKNVEIIELEAAQIPRVKEEMSFVIMNGNYALQAGFSAGKDAIVCETADSEAINSYVNILAVKEGNEDNEGVRALVEVLKSDEIRKFMEEKYNGAVIPFE